MMCLRLGNFLRNERNAGSDSTLVSNYPMILTVSSILVHEKCKDIFIIKTGGAV